MKLLGTSVRQPVDHVEPIPLEKGHNLSIVTFKVTEFTAVCPVTGQPDYYDILIELKPKRSSIESKSLKLWLWQYRHTGIFCETLAEAVLEEVTTIIKPLTARVTVSQASRGGIQVSSVSGSIEPPPHSFRSNWRPPERVTAS